MRSYAKWIFRISLVVLLILAITSLVLYLRSRELKAVLAGKICDELSIRIGQKVSIKDFDLSLSSLILHHVTIHNPDTFLAGNLLTVETLRVAPGLKEISQGDIYFKSIDIFHPRITLVRNKQGNWNISDKLWKLITEKPKKRMKYRIDNLRLDSGQIELEGEFPFQAEIPFLRMKSLSSEPGVKTSIEGSIVQSNGNELAFNGWAYLQDDKKASDISLNGRISSLAMLERRLKQYGVSTRNAGITLTSSIRGDSEQGFNLAAHVSAKKLKLPFLKTETAELAGKINALLHLKTSSITINSLSLRADRFLAAEVRGDVRFADWKKSLPYAVETRIGKIELSSFALPGGMEAEGLLSSPGISVKGNMHHSAIFASGSCRIEGGTLKSEDFHFRNIASKITFLPSKELSVKAQVSGDMLRVGKYVFDTPLHAASSSSLNGMPGKNLRLESTLNSSDFAVKLDASKNLTIGSGKIYLNGVMQALSFRGAVSAEMEDLKFSDFSLKKPKLGSGLEYKDGELNFENLGLQSAQAAMSMAKLGIVVSEGKKRFRITGKELNGSYRPNGAAVSNAAFSLDLTRGSQKEPMSAAVELSAGRIEYAGLASGFSARALLNQGLFNTSFSLNGIAGGKINCAASGKALPSDPFPLQLSIGAEGLDILPLWEKFAKTKEVPSISGKVRRAEFNGSILQQNLIVGAGTLALTGISVTDSETKRSLIKEGVLDSKAELKGKDARFDSALAVGPVSLRIEGRASDFLERSRNISAHAALPEAKLTDIRTAFWDIIPDGMLYLGLDGALSSDFQLDYSGGNMGLNGTVLLKDITVQGENGEYSIGPILGEVPVKYASGQKADLVGQLPAFEAANFNGLQTHYSRPPSGLYKVIDVGTVSYGFKLLDKVKLLVRAKQNILELGLLSSEVFNGSLKGSGMVDYSKGLNYSGGFILEDLSLANLTDSIEPIRRYLSGKINGVGYLKGNGASIPQLKGKAEFWAHSAQGEKMKISREFLQKLGGPSLKSYISERSFDRGVMSVYLSEGDLIFKELEISNRNIFGIMDLSIKVAPLNNRISLDHLMWSIAEAASRAKEKQGQQ